MSFKNVAIIGGGNLGSSIAKGFLEAKLISPSDLSVTRRRLHLIDDLKMAGVVVTTSNVEAVKSAELIILAVKPHQVVGVMDEISDYIDSKKHVLVSVITGVSSSQLEEMFPGIPVFRAMPNTAIALQESMTCLSSNGRYPEQEQKIKGLFDQLGVTIVINEELMGAATVIGACGIAFALRFMRAMSQGGIEIGFGAEISQLITAQTIKGASQLILESNNHPEREIDKVTTPMGVTISGLNEMEHQGFSSAVIKGLLTSFNKLGHVKSNNKN